MTDDGSTRRLVFACREGQLVAGKVLVVHLTPDAEGRPREAIVLLDDSHTPRAYLNRCRHLPVPLDAASRRFLAYGYLQCLTHGARYRLNDGFCVSGPCRGESLEALELRAIEHELFVYEPY